MRLPDIALRILGLSFIQRPFAPAPVASPQPPTMPTEFALKESPDILSPQDMLSLPRPGVPLPNSVGDLALIPVSTYSSDDRKIQKSIAITPIEPGFLPYNLSLPDGGDAFWLDPRTIAHVVETGEGKEKKQELFAIPVVLSEHGGVTGVGKPVPVGSFPVTTAADFRYAHTTSVLVFSAYVHADGDIKAVKDNDEKYENRGNTALVYDKGFERQWDTWVGPKHKALFTVRLYTDGEKFILGEDFTNILQGTELSSPVEPFGGTDDFDISDSHIIFTAKDPQLPKASHTKQNIYLVDFRGSNLVELTSGVHGATHAPAFSRQGDKVAWLQLDEDGHESDRAKIVICHLATHNSFTIAEDWDRSPSSLVFSESGEFIYLTVGDNARVKIFLLSTSPPPSNTPPPNSTPPVLTSPYDTPVLLTDLHTASGLQVLSDGRLLFALSSLTSPNDAYVIDSHQLIAATLKQDPTSSVVARPIRITNLSSSFLQGKHLHPGEEFWFEGAEHRIHGWILTPPGYESTDVKKWPVVLLIHGGPEACWDDSWSTRWNPNVFASQGYIVVAINPTGSTSFGQALTEGIKEDWGGKPFVDLRNGWKYVLEHYPQIDPERAVAAGASWGGYAINWIQGNPDFGFGFKALVCHDGVFDTTYNGYATDELFFFNHEWGGRPWEEKAFALSRKQVPYSPAYTVNRWSTPQLIIHGSKDYRLPEGDGISVWHALQQLGVRSRLVIFPDENHWVVNPGNSLKWHYEVFRWFDEFVGDRASAQERN